MALFTESPNRTEEKISFQVPDRVQQVLTPTGKVVGAIPQLSNDELISFYRWMVFGRIFSDRMVALQRQGRMGTFAPLKGQEAAAVGLAAPLESDDWLVASYRENISHIMKGAQPLAIMKQWGGHFADSYPREINAPPFQVVLSTQMLHAVGVAQAIKYNKQPHVVVATCGDGATSEGDFNEALNFAGVSNVPAVFVVFNNGWAISTPRDSQTAAEYIADRGPGFGIRSCVVDGNDVLAVYQVVGEAVAHARAGEGPTLIEAITYRMGAHTTADDPTKYRTQAEVDEWLKRDPITRYHKFLIDSEILTEAEVQKIHTAVETEIDAAVEAYEALPAPTPEQQYKNVYADMPPQLQRHQTQLLQDLSPTKSGSNGSHA